MYWEPFGVALVLKMLSACFPLRGNNGCLPHPPARLSPHASPAGGSAGRSEAIGVLPSPRSGSPLRLHCLPLTREVAKPQALTEGEMIGNALLRWGILRLFLPPQSAPQTAPPLGAPFRAQLFSNASPIGGSAGRSEPIGGHAFPILPRGGKCHGFSSSSPLRSGIRSGPKAKTKRKTAA